MIAGYSQVTDTLVFVPTGFRNGLRKFKVLLRGDAEIKADLVVDMQANAGVGEVEPLHNPVSLPSITFSVGILPIVITSDVAMAARGSN